MEGLARKMGFAVSKVTQIPGLKVHADMVIFNLFDDYQGTAIDVTVRSPYAVTFPKRKKLDPMKHLLSAEKEKYDTYKDKYVQMARGFKPFALSSTGLFSYGAREVVDALSRRYALQNFVPLQTAKYRVSNFISCSVLRQVAQNSVRAQSKIHTAVDVAPTVV